MSHLDEGTLHAWLDGELAMSEVRHIETHLVRCGPCGTRLEEVKTVRSEAERLVGSLAPAGIGAATMPTPKFAPPADDWAGPILLIPDPPDAVLRSRQRARALGWAATVMVAVGAGYLALGARGETAFSSPEVEAVEQPRTGTPAEDSPVLSEEEAVQQPQQEQGEQAEEQQAATPPQPPPSRPAPAPRLDELVTTATPKKPTPATREDSPAAELANIEGSRATDERASAESPDESDVRRLRAAAATADLDRQRREAERREAEQREAAQRAAAASVPAPAPPPPSLEQRAQVYLRIGLDEAMRQLGSPMHVIEGMSPALIGLAQGRLAPGMDTARPVVRAVYLDPTNRLILLDQQRMRPGQTPGPTAAVRSVIGDVIVQLHGEPNLSVLRNLATRIR